MRITYSIIYLLLIFALTVCGMTALRSNGKTRRSVALLEFSLIPPVLGNMLIVGTSLKCTSLIGCYLYYLGMDLVMFALVNFTNSYCQGTGDGTRKPTVIYILIGIDAVQMLLDTVTHHAFEVKKIMVENAPYYKMIPHWGQTLHRIIDYFAFFCVLLLFILASIKTPKISRERYTVILITMIAVSMLLSYNIFFQYAIDRSMIGFGVFGITIFYFSTKYKPLRLLDKVLSNIVSGLSDSFYVFDPNGSCVWANEQGCRLVGLSSGNYDAVTAKLMEMFGDDLHLEDHTVNRKVMEGSDSRFYILEENQVMDSKGRCDGSYIRIQDVTEGEQKLKEQEEQIGQISMEAYKDPLTGVGSKVSYIKKVSELNSKLIGGNLQIAVVMVDMNGLKNINDSHGHKAGDAYIMGCCHLICDTFKHSPVFRIGGDEFVVILQGKDYEERVQKTEALRNAYSESYSDTAKEPWLRFSAAVGMAENAYDDFSFELIFKRADKAMYDDKKRFKEKYGTAR